MKAKEQLPHFVQGETGLPRLLDHSQPVKHCRVVTTLATDAFRWKQYSNLFVIANRRRLKSNLSRHLRNGHLRHIRILDYALEPLATDHAANRQ